MGTVLSTDLAVTESPQLVHLSNEQLRYISTTEFVPSGLRGNLPAIMACVATGRAIGIDDMSALRLIHVVNGRPTFSAELQVQIVRRRGHSIVGEFGEGECTVTGKRADNGDSMTVTWTLAMAERAGLAGKQVWKAYPEALLWARAVSQLCRMLFADCFAGGTYTPEEIEDGELLDDEQDSVGEPQAGEASAVEAHSESTVSEASGVPGEPPSPADTPEPITAAQKKKANLLVGQLREAGRITNEQLWRSTSREPVPSEDGLVHWSPLRELLSKDEASALIERLQKYAEASVRDSEPVAN